MAHTGVLLINLGTPTHYKPSAVYRYLTQFLNDPRVIDIPAPLRWILINGIVVPWRYKKSAQAYQKIGRPEGAPLWLHSRALQQALAEELGEDYRVAVGMRYGKPTLTSALQHLRDCSHLVIIPLFPQYSSAATGSATEATLRALASQWHIPHLHLIRDFYNNPAFIQAYADLIRENTRQKPVDLLLFSYHGLPERHLQKSPCKNACSSAARPPIYPGNAVCYRAQCYETARLIASRLGISSAQYHVAFQSRLGRTPWIKPYSDHMLVKLAEQGVKHLAVVCPSFIADCLETLEEVDIRLRQQWMQLGGTTFTFIPCVNNHPVWVKGLAAMSRRQTIP